MSIFVKMQWLVLLRGNLNKIIGLILVCGGAAINAQPLTIQPINYSDSTVWYIRNNTADTLYPTSLTFKVHHMLPNAAILPVYTGPGFFNNTQKITIKGKKYTWKYTTSFGSSIEDTLFPGLSIPFAISVNYNSSSNDTIMPSNVTLFTNKPQIKEWPVVPNGASCDYKRIFITSRCNQQGIHIYSTVYPSLNPNVCQSISSGAAVANVFNPYSMQQIPSRVVPKCAAGRKWTSFGYPKDSVLFYSFNTMDGKHLDSIIEGLDSGDYFAYASWPTVSSTDLYAQSKTWAKVGLDINEIPFGTGGQFCFLGRKGLAKGMAQFRYEKVVGSLVSVTADYVMIKEQGFNELKPYPDCFEDIAIEHKPYVPEVVKNGITTFKNSVRIFPNPINSGILNLQCSSERGFFAIMDLQGRIMRQGSFFKDKVQQINTSDFISGNYFLVLKSENGVVFSRSLVKL